MKNKLPQFILCILFFLILFINISIAQELQSNNLETSAPEQKTISQEVNNKFSEQTTTSEEIKKEIPTNNNQELNSEIILPNNKNKINSENISVLTEKPIINLTLENNNREDGNRLKKIEYRSGNISNNETTYYFNSRPVDFIQVRNSSGIFNFSYYYMNDKLVAMKGPTGKMLYYHDDHLGSTTLVTNQSGDVVENDVYLPYGGIYSGAASSKYLFTGKERDDGTGFDYFGARYYSSQFMHFLQPDSVIRNIYDPQNLNRYAYVLNNPYKYKDPSGHFIDTAADVFFIGYDIYTIIQEPKNSVNYIALVADVGGAIIPFATGLGIAVRTAKIADKALETVTTAEKIVDGVKGVNAIEDAKKVEEASNLFKTGGETSGGIFKDLSPKQFRNQYIKETGDVAKGKDVHHLIPKNQGLRGTFNELGFSDEFINSVENAMSVNAGHGKDWRNYENDLLSWMRAHEGASAEQILNYAKKLSGGRYK